MVDTPVSAAASATLTRAGRAAAEKRWRKAFLETLAATSNVAASARAATVPPARAYDARRKDPAFHRAWQEALCEGYEHLEMKRSSGCAKARSSALPVPRWACASMTMPPPCGCWPRTANR